MPDTPNHTPPNQPKNPPDMPEYREGAGNPPPAYDSSPGAQGSSSAGGPPPKARKDANAPKVTGQGGFAGEEVAINAGRTNWPDDPDRYLASNLQSAAGHRPPTLAKDPTAPVYVPGDPNTLVPGEVDSAGREVNPPPSPLPEAGDDYYMPRPEPALDDIPRDSRHARTQEAAALEQANLEAREEIITRDPEAGKGQLKAESDGPLSRNRRDARSGDDDGNDAGAKTYRPSAKSPTHAPRKPAA